MFTNLDNNGREGPDSIGSHYKGQDHDGQVTLSNGIQLWTVPHTGEYRIEAIGAPGGRSEDSVIEKGGRGARIIGNFTLTKNEIIRILVGQKRGNQTKNCRRWRRYICSEGKQQAFDYGWRWRGSSKNVRTTSRM